MASAVEWVLLVCSLFVVAGVELNSTVWPCGHTAPLSGVALDALLGTWFLEESIQLLPNPRPNLCQGIILSGNETQTLTKSGFSFPTPGGEAQFENYTLAASSPGIWDEPEVGLTTIVVDLTNSSLVLSSCLRSLEYQWTGVFARQRGLNTSELDGIHGRLRTAGVAHMDQVVREDSTGCTAQLTPLL